ncbi:MAG TPA: hypothetical protein VF192_07085, partial [Longimicrobiales bacterium]
MGQRISGGIASDSRERGSRPDCRRSARRAAAWRAAAVLLLVPGALGAQTGRPLRGRVVDAAGNPLAGASVEVLGS